MSTATEAPGANPPPGANAGIDPVLVAEERRYRPNPAEVQRLAAEEDQVFLLDEDLRDELLRGRWCLQFSGHLDELTRQLIGDLRRSGG